MPLETNNFDHIQDQQHPLERTEPDGVMLPAPFPKRIIEAINNLLCPSLIYELQRFQESVKEITQAFDQYFFPLGYLGKALQRLKLFSQNNHSPSDNHLIIVQDMFRIAGNLSS